MKKKIAFVGAGHACLQMIKLFQISEEYKVEVICDKNYNAPAVEYARNNHIHTVRNISDIPSYSIDYLIELTGKNEQVMESIHANIPKNVSIIDSDGAKMFFTLLSLMWEEKSTDTINLLQDITVELNKYFKNFTHIQKTINLLSVNASIEARRAGEFGAGFAAIARAIKDLVLESEKSTLECEQELKKMEQIKLNMKEKDKDLFSLN